MPEFCVKRMIDFSQTANGKELKGNEYVVTEWKDFGLVIIIWWIWCPSPSL
jgi:hypothetical protein